jgi:hypothetical protein
MRRSQSARLAWFCWDPAAFVVAAPVWAMAEEAKSADEPSSAIARVRIVFSP